MILKKFIAFPKISVLLCLVATPTAAQIVPDNTLPQNSIVTPQGDINPSCGLRSQEDYFRRSRTTSLRVVGYRVYTTVN